MKSFLSSLSRWAVTLLFFAVAVLVALSVWKRYEGRPWTRDGHVRADVVRVSSDVGGLVTQVLVHDNQAVKTGQLLLVLDKPRFSAALEQADAAIKSAQTALELARRESQRDRALGDLVATESHEQNLAKVDTAAANLAQAIAARHVAAINLERTEVRASVDGAVTNLDLHPGDFLSAGAQALALIDTDSLRIEAYLEETKLRCVAVGNEATIHLMGDRGDLTGHVESIAGGIADDQRSHGADLLPAITPTFSWVRLAQRIPVRIRLDGVPRGTRLIAGRTATVNITPSADGGCQ